MTNPKYKNGIMVAENTIENRVLYPRPIECPKCWYNLRRFKVMHNMDMDAYLSECPNCKFEIVGW